MNPMQERYEYWREQCKERDGYFAPTFEACFTAGYEANQRIDGWRRQRAEYALERIYEAIYGVEHSGLLITQSKIDDMIERITNPDYEEDKR